MVIERPRSTRRGEVNKNKNNPSLFVGSLSTFKSRGEYVMLNKKGLSRFVLLLVLVFALAAFPASVSANHSWGGYHWARTSNPFTIKLGDNVSGAWDQMLVIASNDWSQSNVLDTTVVAGGTRPKSCRATAGRVEVCSANYN